MKRRTILVGMLGLGLSFPMQALHAQDPNLLEETLKRTTTSGREIDIGMTARWDRNCQPMTPPRVVLVKPPGHGSVCTRATPVTLQRNLAPNKSSACLGKPIAGLQIVYFPELGYAGSDNVDYLIEFPVKRKATHVDIDIRPAPGAPASKAGSTPLDSGRPGNTMPACAPLMS